LFSLFYLTALFIYIILYLLVTEEKLKVKSVAELSNDRKCA
jgi:hypothetical protein